MISVEFELHEIEEIPSIVVMDALELFNPEEFCQKRKDEMESIKDAKELFNAIKEWCQEEASRIFDEMGEIYETENGIQEKDLRHVFQDAIAGNYYKALIDEMIGEVINANN